jgi:acyl-coenzyme A thioesterase PaaI-like protein
MAYWPGLVMFLVAGWMIWSSIQRRNRARAEAARGEAPPPLHHSLVMMAEVGPSLIYFGLAVAAGQVVLAWLATGGAGFALLDLAGLLTLLSAYGVWVRFRTRYRLAAPAR